MVRIVTEGSIMQASKIKFRGTYQERLALLKSQEITQQQFCKILYRSDTYHEPNSTF